MSARKKLGFGELFDTTDPQVDNMDDVIGLCSGQFLTQGKMSSYMPKNDTPGQFPVNYGSQNSQDVIFDTPDTVILTENLNEEIKKSERKDDVYHYQDSDVSISNKNMQCLTAPIQTQRKNVYMLRKTCWCLQIDIVTVL